MAVAPESRGVTIIAAAVVVALAGAGLLSGSYLSDAKQAAADAAADTVACRQWAGRITAARRGAAGNVGPTTRGEDEIGPRLERAMSAAGIDADALTRVAPQPPRRIGQTAYARRATQVALQDVTVRQALAFVATLAGGRNGGVSLDSFQLTAPAAGPAAGGGDAWEVELTASQTTALAPGHR